MSARNSATKLNAWTATQIIAAIGSGRTTCEAVARACLARIEEREPRVQAWQFIDPEYVIKRARALDRSGRRGPLIGVPFGVKDIIDTCDMPTEYGSPIYRGHRSVRDAACVALSRKAGALLIITTCFRGEEPDNEPV